MLWCEKGGRYGGVVENEDVDVELCGGLDLSKEFGKLCGLDRWKELWGHARR